MSKLVWTSQKNVCLAYLHLDLPFRRLFRCLSPLQQPLRKNKWKFVLALSDFTRFFIFFWNKILNYVKLWWLGQLHCIKYNWELLLLLFAVTPITMGINPSWRIIQISMPYLHANTFCSIMRQLFKFSSLWYLSQNYRWNYLYEIFLILHFKKKGDWREHGIYNLHITHNKLPVFWLILFGFGSTLSKHFAIMIPIFAYISNL